MFSTAVFSGFTSTGQVIIPVGVRQFTIDVVSGSAVVNGLLFVAPQKLTMSMPDSKDLLANSIAVGMTGGLAAANRTTVFWTT